MTAPSSPPGVAAARILLVEDHAMFRERLAQLIEEEFGFCVCGQTDSIREAMDLAKSAAPDLAIIDISLRGSGGLELLKNWKAQGIELPVLVLSMHEESLYAERVLAAGAKGYLTKHENSETLLRAIQRVLEGKIYVSDQMMEHMLSAMTGRAGTAPAISRLADRELEVFQLIGRGRTTREISEMLSLGITTVDTYRTRIKEKLKFASGAELVRCASRWVVEGS